MLSSELSVQLSASEPLAVMLSTSVDCSLSILILSAVSINRKK
jgi:hypothetical protein